MADFSRWASHKPSSKSAIEREQCQACLSIAEREQIMQYGLWQDYGTGRETPRKSSAERELAHTSAEAQPGSRLRHPHGNSGDIGRTNRGSSESRGELARAMPSRDRGRRSQRRQRRQWFSRKYYASVMRLKEFYEDNVGRSFTGILSDFARRKKINFTLFNDLICLKIF